MDTAIAIIIIAVAGFFVVRKLRNQFKAKNGCGCGCSGDCGAKDAAGSCDGDNRSCDK